jgi:tetratricopeptide (TPR) repeat protein
LRRRTLAAGLIALTFLAYWPVLRGEFVWDDLMVVAKNPLVTGEFSLSNIWFRTDFPLTSVALWLQWLLWGPHPAGYHIVNVALHALNAILVWLLLERLCGTQRELNRLNELKEGECLGQTLPPHLTHLTYLTSAGWAWFSAALFAVHPVGVASAGWISEQKNTLSLFFGLLAFVFYVKSVARSPWSYLLSLLAFVLALLAKTSTVVLPAVLVLWTWWQGRLHVESCRVQVDSAAGGQPSAKTDPTAETDGQPSTFNLQLSTFLRTAPFLLLALGFGAMTVWFQSHQAFTTATVQTENFWGRLAGAGWAVWFYLGKALLPLNLNLIYPRWQIHPENWSAWMPLAELMTVLAAGWWVGFHRPIGRARLSLARRENQADTTTRPAGDRRALPQEPTAAGFWACTAFLLLVCFVVCLFPALGFLDFFYLAISRVSDQFQYLALIPIMVGVALVAGVISNQWSVISDRVRGQRSEVRSQGSARAAASGNSLNHQSINPSPSIQNPASGLFAAALILAFTLLTFQRAKIFASNERLWADVLAKNPTAWTAHNNLGCILAEQKKYDAAADEFAASLQYYSQNEQAHLNLGKTLLLLGQVAEAEGHFQTATQLKPGDGEAHKLLGTAFARQGRNQEALREWRAGLQLAPDLDTRLQLARLLAALGRTTEAVAEFRQAVAAYPKAVAPVNDLAWTLATCADPKVRDGVEAIRLAERACQLTGYREPVPVGTLAAAYAAAGRFTEAASTVESAIKLATASGNQRFVALNQRLLALYRDGKAFTEGSGRGSNQ